MAEPEVIDGEVVGAELAPVEQQAAATAPMHATLFATDDPVEVVEQATRVADALKSVLVQQGMIQKIGQGEHVRVEGWQTLGGMLGVVPVVMWTKRVTDPDGWEAKVEARTLDGRVVGAGEAQCDRAESRWKKADEHAIRSMAQTRATSKALAAPLRFIVKLAGFSGTPAEEMPAEPSGYGTPPDDGLASPSQRRLIYQEASGKLMGLELLNIVREAKGEPAAEVSEQDAIRRLDDEIGSLPADAVKTVMQRIAA